MKIFTNLVHRAFLLSWCLVAAGFCSAAALGAEFTESEFHRLHQDLRPDPDARWRSIPWKISLLDAQKLAVEQKRPLFIWAMDGHPLGCT